MRSKRRPKFRYFMAMPVRRHVLVRRQGYDTQRPVLYAEFYSTFDFKGGFFHAGTQAETMSELLEKFKEFARKCDEEVRKERRQSPTDRL